MKREMVDEKQICRYLLGDLKEEEQQQLEKQLMTQNDLFARLQILEDELIDEYVEDTLSPQDREGFEKRFLSNPERRQKLSFAEALRGYVAGMHEGQQAPSFWQSLLVALRPQSLVLRYGLPMALLGVVAYGLWMGGTIRRLHSEVAQIRTQQGAWQAREQQLHQQLEQQRQRNQELKQQLTAAQAQHKTSVSPSPVLAAFALMPGLVRDSGTTNRVVISSGTSLAALRLELADNRYQNYRAVLQDSEGSEIWTLNKAKPERTGTDQVVVLTLPVNILPRGDYSLKLSGVNNTGAYDPLGNYYFRVLRK